MFNMQLGTSYCHNSNKVELVYNIRWREQQWLASEIAQVD